MCACTVIRVCSCLCLYVMIFMNVSLILSGHAFDALPLFLGPPMVCEGNSEIYNLKKYSSAF